MNIMKSAKPKLTVALLTYNRAHFLKYAIDGILNQTYKDFELMILDNASTDKTEEVVRGFADPRIIYIKHRRNVGAANLNIALRLNKSPYFIISHDDDIMKPNLLEKEVEILDNNENVVMVSSNIDTIDINNGIISNNLFLLDQDVVYKKNEYIKDFCQGRNLIACPTVMLRMDFINKNKLFFKWKKVGPVSDVFFWFEVNLHDKYIYITKDSLYLYRVHENQDSVKNVIDMHISFYKCVEPFFIANGLQEMILKFKNMLFGLILSIIILKYHKGFIRAKQRNIELAKLKAAHLWGKDILAKWRFKLFLVRLPLFISKSSLFFWGIARKLKGFKLKKFDKIKQIKA